MHAKAWDPMPTESNHCLSDCPTCERQGIKGVTTRCARGNHRDGWHACMWHRCGGSCCRDDGNRCIKPVDHALNEGLSFAAFCECPTHCPTGPVALADATQGVLFDPNAERPLAPRRTAAEDAQILRNQGQSYGNYASDVQQERDLFHARKPRRRSSKSRSPSAGGGRRRNRRDGDY